MEQGYNVALNMEALVFILSFSVFLSHMFLSRLTNFSERN